MIVAAVQKEDEEEPCGDKARGDEEAMVKAVGKEGL
jgi:hypothetical protein